MNWLSKLERTKKELEDTINLERRKLMMEKEMVSFQLSNLEKKIQEITELEKELEIFIEEKEEISKIESEKLSKSQFLKDITEKIDKIMNVDEMIKKKGEELQLKISLLNNPEPACPICQKEMRYDLKVNIKNKLNQELIREKELIRRNEEQLESLEKKRLFAEDELKDIERKVMSKPLVLEKSSVLEVKIKDIKEEAGKLQELGNKAKEIEQVLDDNAYAPMDQKLLKEVEREIRKNL